MEEPFATARTTVLHVDMDAFFAAVEVLDDPTLAGRPVIVGGTGTRGVVASCTYEARAKGVHSAMPSVEARRRCPEAVFVSGRFWRYSEVSRELHEIFLSYTPLVEGIALDEAFLDVAGATRLLGDPVEIAHDIRQTVGRQLGLDCSVGVARTKLLAKLASRAAKPRPAPAGTVPGPGVVVVPAERELEFLHPLPVRALWGVGPATAARLAGMGVLTVADLAAVPEGSLRRVVGDANGRQLAALAAGRDERGVEPDRPPKSVGHEETFARDLHDHGALHTHAVRMADAVSARLVEAGLKARTVTLKIRFGDRRTITRAHTLSRPTASARVLRSAAVALLQGVEVGSGVRLLGVAASQLGDGTGDLQLSFGDDFTGPARWVDAESDGPPELDEPGWGEVEEAAAAVRARYGQGALAPASLLGDRGVSVKRRGDTQWGPMAEPGG